MVQSVNNNDNRYNNDFEKRSNLHDFMYNLVINIYAISE